MTLLLRAADLAPLFRDPETIRASFAVIRAALTAPEDGPLGHSSTLAYPLGASEHRVHINVLAGPAGTSIRLFPPAAGPTVATGDAACLLLDEEGRLLALMDLHDLGSWRTSGVAAVACAALAPEGARRAAMLGSGVEARTLLRALREALPSLEEARVYSRTPANRARYAAEMTSERLPVAAVDDARAAVEGADVILATAAGRGPAFAVEWVRPGALVASITWAGAPRDLAARGVIPDRRAPEARPTGWDPWPVDIRGLAPDVLTLADVLRGAPARRSPEETLLYTQLGIFAWDAPLIRWAYETARARGSGTRFDLA